MEPSEQAEFDLKLVEELMDKLKKEKELNDKIKAMKKKAGFNKMSKERQAKWLK